MYKVNEKIINYKLEMDKPSICNVKIYIENDIVIVIFEDLENNNGTVVTEVIEDLAENVYKTLLYDYKISKIFWLHKCITKSLIENENNIYSPEMEGYYKVVMKYKNENFKRPQWKYLGKNFSNATSLVKKITKTEVVKINNKKVDDITQKKSIEDVIEDDVDVKDDIMDSIKTSEENTIITIFELAGYKVFKNVIVAENNIDIFAISHKKILLCTIHNFEGTIKINEESKSKYLPPYWKINGNKVVSPVWKMKKSIEEINSLLDEVLKSNKKIDVNNMVIITNGYITNGSKAMKIWKNEHIKLAGNTKNNTAFLPDYTSILTDETDNPPSPNYLEFIETMIKYFSEVSS